MFFEAKSLLNLPIISLDSGKVLGTISNIIIDPENGKVLGLLSGSGFWQIKKAVSFNDIYEFNPETILVRDDESMVDINNLIRIKKIIEQKIFILNNKVVTESGKKLGKVSDFVINTDLGFLTKIYAEKLWGKNYFGKPLIIPANKIIIIESKKIIISDDILSQEMKEQEIVEEAAIT